jgi:hypothetical protein
MLAGWINRHQQADRGVDDGPDEPQKEHRHGVGA